MIVVDSSVLVAIAFRESDAAALEQAIRDQSRVFLSAANYVETSNVIEGRLGDEGRTKFLDLIADLGEAGMCIVDVSLLQADLAREAFHRFGKGRHPAALNFGDCFAYALAKALDAPLLFKGSDFGKTDLQRA